MHCASAWCVRSFALVKAHHLGLQDGYAAAGAAAHAHHDVVCKAPRKGHTARMDEAAARPVRPDLFCYW